MSNAAAHIQSAAPLDFLRYQHIVNQSKVDENTYHLPQGECVSSFGAATGPVHVMEYNLPEEAHRPSLSHFVAGQGLTFSRQRQRVCAARVR